MCHPRLAEELSDRRQELGCLACGLDLARSHAQPQPGPLHTLGTQLVSAAEQLLVQARASLATLG